MRRSSVAVLISATVLTGVATAIASSGFAAAIYPRPVHSRGGALSACPNPAGLELPTRGRDEGGSAGRRSLRPTIGSR